MRRSILRHLLIQSTAAVACSLLVTTALLAKPGTVKTTSGQSFDGDVTDQGDSYVVTVGKIDNKIAKSDVTSVQYHGSLDDQFADKMKKLDAKDANGRVAVARFAFDNGRNDLAIQALSSAMQIDPKNASAIQMLKTVQAQQQLDQQRAASATPAKTPVATAPSDPATLVPAEKKLLTPADINTIRQQEIKAGEQIPMSIPADLKKNFPAKVGMTFTQFNDLSASEQLRKVLENGDTKAKESVRIMRDPQSIADFKRIIQPLVLRNCATSGCHGGPAGGRLILFNGTDDATTYTNFYIMEKFSQKVTGTGTSGFFGGGSQRKLVDRGNGEKSLLANYGLSPTQAQIPHPPITNSTYTGVFRGPDDRLYQDVIDWMNKSLSRVEPNYDIKYTPPVGKVSTPTTQPQK